MTQTIGRRTRMHGTLTADDEATLRATTDASVWAHLFAKVVAEHPGYATDEGFLLGWFANAIENAKDHALADHSAAHWCVRST